MPPLRREGGPEDEPQARRPAGSLTVCLPRGGWPQARFPEARSLDMRAGGFFFSLPDQSSARWQPLNSEGFMRFSILMFSTIYGVALFAPIARADQPASAASPAQTQPQTQKASPPKKVTQPSAPAKKEEAQRLNPVVVTATRIPQPIGEIGTTITVVEDPQIQAQKIDRVADVLRQVPGVQVTQSGSPGSITDVSIRGAPSSQTLVLVDGVEVNAGATGSFDLANLTTDNLDRVEVQ